MDNKYFDKVTLAGACRFGGVSFKNLPEEGKAMVREYMDEYDKRHAKPKLTYPPPPEGLGHF